MVLSPADFYAYSRATGTPIPEDPQERAEMAPTVLEFRRNQLKAPEQSPNVLQTLGAAAFAGTALVGAGLAARRFLGRQPRIPQGPSRSATAGITQADLARYESDPNLRKAAGTASQVNFNDWLAEKQRAERQEVYSAVAAKPASELKPIYRPKGDVEEDVLITSPITGEIFRRGASPQATEKTYVPPSKKPGEIEGFTSVDVDELLADPTDRLIAELGTELENRRQARIVQNIESKEKAQAQNILAQMRNELESANTLVDQQVSTAPLQTSQFVNAVESGEDQMTGRIKSQLQRNEDLDGSDFEYLENIEEQNYQAMTESVGPGQMMGHEPDFAINQAASELPDGLPYDQAEGTRSVSSQELADIARDEMIALRQKLQTQGLRPGTERFERALAQTWTTKSIPGATPGTAQFRQLQEQGKIDVSLPTAIRKAVDIESAGAGPMGFLPERTVVNIGPEAKITSTAAGTAIRGASPSYQTVPPVERTRQVFGTADPLVPGAPDDVMPDYPSSYTALHQILANPIPEERIDPYAVKRLKGGSPGIGVYGVEPAYVPGAMSKATGQYSAASTRQPTYVPAWLQKKELPPIKTGFERLSTSTIEGLIAGEGKMPLSKTRMQMAQNIIAERQRAKESLAASEVLRRARIEGRNPQDLLRRFGV